MHCKMWKYNYEYMCMGAVCMCMRTRKREHFYLILLQLHWLLFCEAPLETLCSTRSGALNLQHILSQEHRNREQQMQQQKWQQIPRL